MIRGRVGVLGTLVWDRHLDPTTGAVLVEGWGGIAYSLAALSAAVPPGWRIRPLLQVGSDLAAQARLMLDRLPGVESCGLIETDAPNNRVDLRYHTAHERTEHLRGGVPPWAGAALTDALEPCDVLYANFISGMEIDVHAMADVRCGFAGPVYADLHSLFLGVEEDGKRVWRRPPDAEPWLECFDAVQVNARELALLADGEEPWAHAVEVVRSGPRLLVATLGPDGAAVVARSGAADEPTHWRSGSGAPTGAPTVLRSSTMPRSGDPTGCGDVWGAAFFARLLAGDAAPEAMRVAHRFAAAALDQRVATGLERRFGTVGVRERVPVRDADPHARCGGGS